MALDVRTFPVPPGTPDLVRRLAGYVTELARDWSGFALSDGGDIELTLDSGANIVAHQLLRKPRGFLVLNPQNATPIYASDWANRTATHIELTAPADMDVTVRFF